MKHLLHEIWQNFANNDIKLLRLSIKSETFAKIVLFMECR